MTTQGHAKSTPRAQTRKTALLTGALSLAAALALRVLLNQAIGNALPFVTVFVATAGAV